VNQTAFQFNKYDSNSIVIKTSILNLKMS